MIDTEALAKEALDTANEAAVDAGVALAVANDLAPRVAAGARELANHGARLAQLERDGGGGGGGGPAPLPVADPTVFEAACDPVVPVGIVVAAGGPGVQPANPTDLSAMPGLGIVVAKPSPTTARVQACGVVPGGVLSGLTPGATHYVGEGGALISALPTGPDFAQQRVGVAVTATLFVLAPSLDLVISR